MRLDSLAAKLRPLPKRTKANNDNIGVFEITLHLAPRCSGKKTKPARPLHLILRCRPSETVHYY